MAVLQYEQDHGCFPPAYIADENGKPMHSWRVLILPYIERRDLYEAYRFDEPWDGPNNRKLHNVTLDLYKCPSDNQHGGESNTSYLAVVGPHVAWAGEKARTWEDFTDGTEIPSCLSSRPTPAYTGWNHVISISLQCRQAAKNHPATARLEKALWQTTVVAQWLHLWTGISSLYAWTQSRKLSRRFSQSTALRIPPSWIGNPIGCMIYFGF